MRRPNYTDKIRTRIEEAEGGSVFVSVDFIDITEKTTVNIILIRLAEEGLLKKIMFGVYYKPGVYEKSNSPITPSPDDIAHALARNYGWTIIPCGETALDILQISQQWSGEWVYVTDGPYKVYTYDDSVIKFRHRANKEISKVSYTTAVFIQAIKSLGKENVTEQIIEHLKTYVNENQKVQMLEEAKPVTAWVYEIIKKICK